MPLSPGEKLGPYEIAALIGQGGMGEVYRAHDSRLGRDVAIKVSQERFSERFDREARAVAALNHPNICTLYDVGPNYLVMEFVEGEAPKGPLPLDTALLYAHQIADALEAAHEKNIVHRDLKPGNIKITPSGTVKVLDFGLAKMHSGPAAQSENSPTLSMAATQAGVILGTAGYMSPEQARGKNVDKRADIWAFGVVFYELLTGKRVFQGEDVTDTLAKVIQGEPKLDGVPANVQRLLRGCLEKDPAKRLRDIGDVWRLMEDPTLAAPSPSRLGSAPAWIAVGVAVAIAAGLGWGWWRASQPVERPLVRLDIDLGADVSLPRISNGPGAIVISPDGARLVYISGTPRRLFLRRLDQPKSSPLPGTDGASDPFFSPDGQWIGFVARNKLNKISVEGGAVVPLADLPINAGLSWGDDGYILAGGAFNGGLRRIPYGGGASSTVTELVSGEIAHALPHYLPGNQFALFASYAALDADRASVEAVTLADHKRKTLMRGGTTPRFLAGAKGAGYLIYNNKGTLFAIAFDPDRLETRGTAVPILDDVAFDPDTGTASFAVSQTGTLVYRKGGAETSFARSTIQWVDPAGKKSALREKPGEYRNMRLSPDGTRLALALSDGSNGDIWIYEPARDAMTRLTFGGGVYEAPVWSPDGRFVVFGSIGNGLFWTRSDGAGQPQPLTQSKTVQIPVSFLPDGKRLGYFEIAGAPQMWSVPLQEEGGQLKAGKPEQFLKTQFADSGPIFSPDGHWVAYQSNESGKTEVYVRAFPQPSTGQGGKWQISNDGGTFPLWSRNGRELLYRSGDKVMKANYTVKGDSFVNEKPSVWIDKAGGGVPTWDVSPDGKRALVILPVDSPETPKQDHEAVILFNFLDELRRKVPAGK